MDISDINLIKTIIQSGSLTEASNALNQSQPTISRKLQRLEDRLGVTLFTRSPKGLAPTSVATYIVSQSEPLEHHLASINRQIELMADLQTGEIRVGVGPIIEQVLIPNVLAAFWSSTGDTKVSIVTEADTALLDMFTASELDVVIGPFDERHWREKGAVAIPLIGDNIIAVAKSAHPIFKQTRYSWEQLTEYPLLAPKTRGTVTQVEGAPVLQTPSIASDNYNLLLRLTLELDAICGGPRAIFQDYLTSGQLRELSVDLGMYWQSVLLVRPEVLNAPLIKHFVEICESVSRNESRAS